MVNLFIPHRDISIYILLELHMLISINNFMKLFKGFATYLCHLMGLLSPESESLPRCPVDHLKG